MTALGKKNKNNQPNKCEPTVNQISREPLRALRPISFKGRWALGGLVALKEAVRNIPPLLESHQFTSGTTTGTLSSRLGQKRRSWSERGGFTCGASDLRHAAESLATKYRFVATRRQSGINAARLHGCRHMLLPLQQMWRHLVYVTGQLEGRQQEEDLLAPPPLCDETTLTRRYGV